MNNKIITFFCLFLIIGCQNNDIKVLNGSDTSFEKLQGKGSEIDEQISLLQTGKTKGYGFSGGGFNEFNGFM